MTAAIIGISCALAIILLFEFLRKIDKMKMYALILPAIGFLYVGFVWADREAFIIATIQAIAFTFLSYYGSKNVFLLAAGYILHGAWDIAYQLFHLPGIIPPKYDLFCSTLDFVIGIYLLAFRKRIIGRAT